MTGGIGGPGIHWCVVGSKRLWDPGMNWQVSLVFVAPTWMPLDKTVPATGAPVWASVALKVT